jgi:hypothetical protein
MVILSRRLVLALSTSAVSACAVHPLPDDFAMDASAEIVNKVRCEFQSVLKDEVVASLETADAGSPLNKWARYYADGYWGTKDLRDKVKEYKDRGMLDDKQKEIISKIEFFQDVSVSYKFVFDIKEKNRNMLDASINIPISHGELKLGLQSGGDFTRQGIRKIDRSESFAQLLGYVEPTEGPSVPKRPLLPCRDIAVQHENGIYPITGRIGMREFFQTYLAVHQKHVDKSGVETHLPPQTFEDELTFTSMVKAGGKPEYTLAPVVGKPTLASLVADTGFEKTDVHKVTIALTIKEMKKPEDTGEPIKIELGKGVALLVPRPPASKGAKDKAQADLPGGSGKDRSSGGGGRGFLEPPTAAEAMQDANDAIRSLNVRQTQDALKSLVDEGVVSE